jgi:hypothetical protein
MNCLLGIFYSILSLFTPSNEPCAITRLQAIGTGKEPVRACCMAEGKSIAIANQLSNNGIGPVWLGYAPSGQGLIVVNQKADNLVAFAAN